MDIIKETAISAVVVDGKSAGIVIDVAKIQDQGKADTLRQSIEDTLNAKFEDIDISIDPTLDGYRALLQGVLPESIGNYIKMKIDLDGSLHELHEAEIEASVLCEVTDWLKRNDTATDEQRYVCFGIMMPSLTLN